VSARAHDGTGGTPTCTPFALRQILTPNTHYAKGLLIGDRGANREAVWGVCSPIQSLAFYFAGGQEGASSEAVPQEDRCKMLATRLEVRGTKW
jgi:hypothetical protein